MKIVETRGNHIILELWECNAVLIDDVDYVKETMLEAAKRAGAQVVGETTFRFAPHGVSCVVVLAESHLSMHSFYESAYCAVDCYTCGKCDPTKAAEYLKEKFESTKTEITNIERGHFCGIMISKGA